MKRRKARANARTAIYRLIFEPQDTKTLQPWERKRHQDFRERRAGAVQQYMSLHKLADFAPATKLWLESKVLELTTDELKRLKAVS